MFRALSLLLLCIVLQWFLLLVPIFVFWSVYFRDRFIDMGITKSKGKCSYNCARYCKLSSLVDMPFCIPLRLFPCTLPTEYVVENLYFGQHVKWIVLSQCSFNLHFSYYEWSWVSFKMIKDHLHFILVMNSTSVWKWYAVISWRSLILLSQMYLQLPG